MQRGSTITVDYPRELVEPTRFAEACRIAEALLFASQAPLSADDLAARVPQDVSINDVLAQLKEDYAARGVNLICVAGKWMFRTADNLSYLLSREAQDVRKLSRAALETLAVIAYHQPVTRGEIEDIRGVSLHRGSLDALLETGWVRLRGRRRTPGRPVTYGTTDAFLTHFGLAAIDDLPGLDELKGAGFLDGRLPPGFTVPLPSDDPTLRADEDPLEEDLFTLLAEEKANAEDEPLSDGETP
jgi:segregation and condensation protein B